MKRSICLIALLILMTLVVLLVQPALGLIPGAQDQGPVEESKPESGGMPPYPLPQKPIPHHEPGHLSRAGSYRTEVMQLNELEMMETLQITGLDAMAADGVDPLAGNYTLVNWDKILMSSYAANDLGLQTFKFITPTLNVIPGSQRIIGNYPSNDITAGDLNGDGQAEQIVAWINPEDNQVYMSIGEMPGSLGKTTSKPAAVVHSDGSMDLLVRGYEEALWHQHSDDGSSWGEWNNLAGDLLLSGPAIASKGDDSFHVFVIGSDNQIYQRQWNGLSWSSPWVKVGESDDWKPLDFWFGPTPELPAPAAIARGTQVDLFRLGPDNTLRWLHSNDGTNWVAWKNLGGMLASGPGVVSMGPDHMQVFACGVDEALWSMTYSDGEWGEWQRIELNGMDEGVTIASAPTAVSSGTGKIRVYVRGSDNRPYWINYAGGSWESWTQGEGKLASGLGAVWLNDHYSLFAQKVDGSLQQSDDGKSWNDDDWLKGLPPGPPRTQNVPTGLIGYPWPDDYRSIYHDFSLDIETGYFYGDGRQQIVLAYHKQAAGETGSDLIGLAMWDPWDPMPQTIEHDPLGDWSCEYANTRVVKITTGNFDGEGRDEIAAVLACGPLENPKYHVEVFSVKPLMDDTGPGYNIQTVASSTEATVEPSSDFISIEIEAGDFDGSGDDEIVVGSSWHRTGNYEDHVQAYKVYDLFGDQLEDVGGSPGSKFYIKTFGRCDGSNKCFCDSFPFHCPHGKNFWLEQGLDLAVGNFDDDEADEFVTLLSAAGNWEEKVGDYWNAERYLLAFSYPMTATKNLTSDTKIWTVNGSVEEDFTKWAFPDEPIKRWDGAQLDRLVAGDLDLDLVDEIGHLYRNAGGEYKLNIYDLSGLESVDWFNPTPAVSQTMAISLNYPKLAAGDFIGESVRVGRPSYRVQNRVDTLLAVVNMPPKHRDLIQDSQGNFELIESPEGECNPSPDSPDCTHAKYATLDFQSSEQTIQTVHDYTISAGVEQKTCVGGGIEGVASGEACVQASIDATHGGNFEKSTETIQSVGFRRKVIAANDDKVVYFGTPYGVWEYPVLSGIAGETSEDLSITVAFPLVSMTQYPDTSGGYYGGTCDEAWFSTGHQPNNVWSYDPIGDVDFEDYDSRFELVYDAIEGDWAEGEIAYEDLKKEFESVSFKHSISARVGYESKVEAKTGFVNVSSNFKAYVQGDYANTSLDTDTVTNKKETTFSYFLAPQPDSAKFTTRVLFYKAKDNSLVLNYQAEPGRSASWQLYDRPDPAFILPWYGFPDPDDPQGPPCGEEQKLFSPDIVINPPYASLGETVTISATVRNFSNEQTGNVVVRFYQGDPANNVVIGPDQVISSLSREAGPQTATTTWKAAGVSEQKIFAVIDPEDTILEMHDGDDLINNNVAYGLVQLSGAGIADMGQAAEQPYDVISYTLGSPRPIVSLYVPRASLAAVARFEVGGAEIAAPTEELAGNSAFEVSAFQGSKYTMWDEPIKNFEITQAGSNDPPAVIIVSYSDADIAGLNEANLTLYRFDGFKWEPATCTGYQIVRLPEDNFISVPVCNTGVFALSDKLPPLGENMIHLPLILKSAGLPAPDLVVKSINATVDNVRVVIKNEGSAPVNDAFWVDVYIDPVPAPTRVNQLWHDLADQGLVWGVVAPALPIDPAEELILTYQGDYYSASKSSFSQTLPLATPLYAQVDSAHTGTDYGGVRESHELAGGPYNNITGPVLSTAGTLERVKSAGQSTIGGDLPPRR